MALLACLCGVYSQLVLIKVPPPHSDLGPQVDKGILASHILLCEPPLREKELASDTFKQQREIQARSHIKHIRWRYK